MTPTWGDLVARLLAQELATAAWREPAVGARSRRFAERSRRKLEERIASLAARIAPETWPGPVHALLSRDPDRPDDATALFQFTGATAILSGTPEDPVLAVEGREVAVDGRIRACVESILEIRGRKPAFSMNDLVRAHGDDPGALPEVVGILVAMGLLRMRPT